eukprot:5772386-Amphidinium_carterae.1
MSRRGKIHANLTHHLQRDLHILWRDLAAPCFFGTFFGTLHSQHPSRCANAVARHWLLITTPLDEILLGSECQRQLTRHAILPPAMVSNAKHCREHLPEDGNGGKCGHAEPIDPFGHDEVQGTPAMPCVPYSA